ncbi:hypothetical protein ACFYM0_35130 [Streptomyces sp. NPDC006487]|uniref:hypothetical protein n=1 Tax=Streptomyces sp. NPDC006487 TaxID=3364748 RepID=UPI0036A5D2A2
MWSLQDFLFPSMILKDAGQITAAQAVQTIESAFGPTPGQTSQYVAALVLLAVPAVVLVVAGLKFITQGSTAGGVKERAHHPPPLPPPGARRPPPGSGSSAWGCSCTGATPAPAAGS